MNDDSPEPHGPEETTSRGGLLGTVVRGAGLAGGGYILGQALNLGFYIVLSRLLSPSEFGIYAAATVLIGFGLLLTESGMHSAIIQRRDRLEEAQSTAVVATFLGGILLTLLGLAIAPLLGLIFNDAEVTALAAAASGLVFVHVISVVPNAILQRRFSFLRMVVVGPAEVIAFGVVAIVAAEADLGAWALLIGSYAGAAVSTALAWALARWRPRMGLVSYGMWRELAAYGRHILISTSILRLGEQAADTLIVGRGLGTSSLGQYRYAFRIASMPFTVLLAAAAYVIFPALARIADAPGRLHAAFLRSLRWMCAIGFPAGLLLVPIGPPLAVLVFGEVWLPAGYATMAMCAYAGASSISSAVSELLKADGDPSPLVRMHSTTTIVTAVAMVALVPFGLTAAAAGLSIGACAGAAYAVRVVVGNLEIPFRAIWRDIWPPVVAATVMALTTLPLDRYVLHPAEHGSIIGLLLIGLETIVAGVVYILVLTPIAPRFPRELLAMVRERAWRGPRAGSGDFDEPGPATIEI